MNRNIIYTVRPNMDAYKFDYIDCFQKSIGIALDSYDKNYSSVFYFYMKLVQCYRTEFIEKYDTSLPFFSTVGLITDEVLNLQTCSHIAAENNFHEIVKMQIDKVNPVLVGGNVKELFYSKHYQTADWLHLFVIKGYDDERKIYYTVDGCQKSQEFIYEEFVIEYDTLKRLFISYSELINDNNIYSVEQKKNSRQIEMFNILSELIMILLALNPYDKSRYREVELIDNIAEQITMSQYDESIKTSERFINNVKHKEVLYNELIKIIILFIKDEALIDKLQEHKKLLLEKWNGIANICMAACYRKKVPSKVYERLEDVIEFEACMYKNLTEIKKVLDNINGNCNLNEGYDNWIVENNTDNIITIKNSKILFNFTTDKVYSVWIDDDSPKILFKSFTCEDRDFTFKVKMKVNTFGKTVKYQSGIVFRTVEDNLYFWCTHCGFSIRINETGPNSNLTKDIDVDAPGDEIFLQIRKEKSKYMFSYSFNEFENMNEALVIEDIKSLCQIGLGCQTWDTPEKLRITFSDVKLIS